MRARLVAAFGLAALATAIALAIGASSGHGAPSYATVYDNIPSPQPGNVASWGNEAYSTSEIGVQAGLEGTQRKDPKVTVLMSSWACKHGTWYDRDGGGPLQPDCITNPGSTFSHPITLKLYAVNPDDTPGAVIAEQTKTFDIPYRPTRDDGTHCTGGQWWSSKDEACYNGLAYPVSFSFDGVTLPDEVIVGVSYNTTNHGYSPIGTQACNATTEGCPYDSLNVGVDGNPTVGDPLPAADNIYLNSSYGGWYADGGAGGTGTFRLDSNWLDYQPNIQIEAGGPKVGHPHPGPHSKPPFSKGKGYGHFRHPGDYGWD